MSKLGCVCGHIVVDQTDDLPYKGQILRDQHQNVLWDQVLEGLDALVTAIIADRRDEWISRHFTEAYPHDLDNKSLMSDFIHGLLVAHTLSIYQCEHCG